MKDRNWADLDLEALDYHVSPRDGTASRDDLSSLRDDIARTRGKTADIFNFAELSQIVSRLD